MNELVKMKITKKNRKRSLEKIKDEIKTEKRKKERKKKERKKKEEKKKEKRSKEKDEEG